MQCKQANELFSDYIERALDPALTVSIDNHLAVCGSCREEVGALRRVWTQLEQMPSVEPPLTLRADIFSALDAQQTPPQRAAAGWQTTWRTSLQGLLRPRALAYAAAVLICVLGSLEAVHTQRASLDPLGAIIRLLHPAAPVIEADVKATHSDWIANSAGGGTLRVHLNAISQNDASVAGLNYRADLVRGDANAAGSLQPASLASAKGQFDSTGNTDVTLTIPNGHEGLPDGARLIITLAAPGQSDKGGQQVIVPLKATARTE